ncbi:uncharacterized protein B0T15DRAFT_32313 [Chaetomium strumarium]|uniref:Uncharacterized protein n=1 Tax=Chaetomium strumarium TaxID=1170767 RepID=A0AAJ0M5X9_9PEZI|nr:hypothetical protein B0T15DRAFT_32313 [Chaetomium strumarium]
MLALLPFCKPSTPLDGRFAKYILLPNPQSKMDNEPILGDCLLDRSVVAVEDRRPRAREDPCAFRTRLVDPLGDSEDNLAFESTDKVDAENIRFDDSQCISVGRSMRRFKTVLEPPASCPCEAEQTNEGGIAKGQSSPSTAADPASPEKAAANIDKEPLYALAGKRQGVATHRKALSDPTTIYHSSRANEDVGEDEDNSMEAMNMPFWSLPRRQKRHISYTGGDIPDDMSIISDTSLIPTYFPSDAMKQQRHHHRALFKRLILAKAKAARQTMRQLKRSCRDAVDHVFVEPGIHRTPECVPVGAAF